MEGLVQIITGPDPDSGGAKKYGSGSGTLRKTVIIDRKFIMWYLENL
jgi:hypothetical protein